MILFFHHYIHCHSFFQVYFSILCTISRMQFHFLLQKKYVITLNISVGGRHQNMWNRCQKKHFYQFSLSLALATKQSQKTVMTRKSKDHIWLFLYVLNAHTPHIIQITKYISFIIICPHSHAFSVLYCLSKNEDSDLQRFTSNRSI